MKIKVRHYDYKTGKERIEEEEIKVLFIGKYVEDTQFYDSIDDIKFDDTSEIILREEHNSPYGFSVLWKKDRKNNIYEYDGFGHSGAASIVSCLLKTLKHQAIDKKADKEQLKRFKNCIGRELGMRKSVYPKWVNSGRMKQETADFEINTMAEIYEYFKGLGD